MSVNCPEPVYQYYAGVFALGGAGLAAAAVLRLKKRRESPLEGRWLLLYALMAAAALITLGLSMYYSYAVDYQAQGRYLYPMLLPIALFTAKGLGWLIRRLSPAPAARAAWVGAFCGFSAAVAWLVYHLVFLPY